VPNDAIYPVHIDANDLAYILLRNTGQPKLDDREVTQQLVGRLLFLFLSSHVDFLFGLSQSSQLLVHVRGCAPENLRDLGRPYVQSIQGFNLLFYAESLFAVPPKQQGNYYP